MTKEMRDYLKRALHERRARALHERALAVTVARELDERRQRLLGAIATGSPEQPARQLRRVEGMLRQDRRYRFAPRRYRGKATGEET